MDFQKLEFLADKAKHQYNSGDTLAAIETLRKLKLTAASMESKLKFEINVGKRDAIFIK
jgi:hypothetical protein